MNTYKKITSIYILCLSLFFNVTPCYAQKKQVVKEKKNQFNLSELALPSEVSKVPKKAGAMFYSPSVKDKVLIPVHFWGEVSNSGLHYVPVGTTLIKGLSLAGGPRTDAKLTNIKLTRKGDKNTLFSKMYNLEDGGDQRAYNETLEPGDTVFIKKSTYQQDRAYYTSLIGVFSTILSSILIYREVKR